jgi:hypothetical protein
MEGVLGVSWPVFIGLTVVLFGGAAYITGQTAASNWRPVGTVILYTVLLGLGDRFLVFALFGGPLLSLSGYLLHTAILMVFSLSAYRMTKARKMVSQYPWLFERSGPFSWRDRKAV